MDRKSFLKMFLGFIGITVTAKADQSNKKHTMTLPKKEGKVGQVLVVRNDSKGKVEWVDIAEIQNHHNGI